MISKKIFLPIISFIVIGGAVFGVSQVRAQTGAGAFSGLAQMIAQKFNLDQNQVQDTINQYRQQQKQNRLDVLVQQGKITATQKQAILDELAALKNKYNQASFQNLTSTQRRQRLQAEINELKSWAQSQGINVGYIIPRMGIGLRRIRWLNRI